jgi:hypothetical protein
MGKSYVVIEGRGENGSVEYLLRMLSVDLGHPGAFWSVVGRTTNLKSPSALIQQCERLRARGDCDRALMLQDDEDGCPRTDGPRLSSVVRGLDLPFPVAVVLFFREYETLFLPCLHTMAGRPLKDHRGIELAPLAEGARFSGDPEAMRSAKKEINRFLPRTHPYKETTHQLALTRLLDLATLRASSLPCFGTLERAVAFLLGSAEGVYP